MSSAVAFRLYSAPDPLAGFKREGIGAPRGGNWTEGKRRRKGKGREEKEERGGERAVPYFGKIMLATLTVPASYNQLIFQYLCALTFIN